MTTLFVRTVLLGLLLGTLIVGLYVSVAHSDPYAGKRCASLSLNGPGTLLGTHKADCLAGSNGPDLVKAKAGNDIVSGNHGPDVIKGGLGNDKLWGGKGPDSFHGGAGYDVCHNNAATGHDTFTGCEAIT